MEDLVRVLSVPIRRLGASACCVGAADACVGISLITENWFLSDSCLLTLARSDLECSVGLLGLPCAILSNKFSEARRTGVGIAEPDTDRGAGAPLEILPLRGLTANEESEALRER